MTAFDTAVLALSPDSYWKLDETSGTNLVDSGSAGKDLTLTGSGSTLNVSTGLGGVGNGIDFGGSAYAIRASALTQVATNKFSICGWFYDNATPGDFTQPWFCASFSGGHTDPFYTFGLFKESGGNYRVAVANSGTFTPHDSSVPIIGNGSWHFFVLTYDGTNARLYVDGTNVYSPAVSGNVQNMGSFAIADIPALGSGFTPNIRASSVAYWHDTTLSGTDVTNLYNAGTSGSSQNLTIPFISSGTTLFTPTLSPGVASISLGFISPTTSLFTMTLTDTQSAAVPFIPSSTVLYTMIVTTPLFPAIPFIASSTTLYTIVLHYPPPVIAGFTPGYGQVGDSIYIVGANFTTTTDVSFDGVSASFTVLDDGTILATVPPLATTGFITVTTPEGVATSSFEFTVLAPPPPPPPGARRFPTQHQWRFLFTDLDTVGITSPNDLLSERRISKVLNAATVIEASVFPDDKRVNLLYTDGYPRVAQSNRLVYCFRREGGTPPWKIRAAGILMSPEDEGDADVPTTHFAAYDSWKLLEARPVMNALGELPGQNGFTYLARAGNTIVTDILKNTILAEGGVFIDAGLDFGGTFYWNGIIETTPVITFDIQQGTFVADAWGQLCEAGNLDIVLTPIYDPVRRPGYTHELSIFNLAGSNKRDAIFGWDRLNRNVGRIDRMHDGTPGSFFDKVQYYAGQGGPPIPATGPLVNSDAVDAFGSYWSQQFFPSQTSTDPTGAAVLGLAQQALELAKQGRRTMTLYPLPERAPQPLKDYDVGDRIPIYASNALRVTADGLQRVEGIPIEISDDGVETVAALLCSPDWRPND